MPRHTRSYPRITDIAAKPLRKPKNSQVMHVVKMTAGLPSSRVGKRCSELPKTKTRGKGCRSKTGLYSDKNGRGSAYG